jgi:hypothetical protein
MKVWENKVQRRKFGPKREVTGGWEELHNDENMASNL